MSESKALELAIEIKKVLEDYHSRIMGLIADKHLKDKEVAELKKEVATLKSYIERGSDTVHFEDDED